MSKLINRRNVIKYSLAGLAATGMPSLSGNLFAQRSLATTALGNSLSLIKTGGANQVALTTEHGIVLVDSGPTNSTDALTAELAQLHEDGVSTLFNTHWHADQVGGNAVLGKQGANIIAHQKTHQRLSTQYYIPHENRYQQPYPESAHPTAFFHDHGSMQAGEETIDYGWLVQPHTDGDIYVHFRAANVIAVGDALSPVRDPELDWFGGGWLGGRVNSQDQLLSISNENTLFVPAYGPVMSRADLQAERDLTQEVYTRVLDLIREGCSANCMLNEGALAGLSRNWANPDKFLYDAYKGMWAHHYNLAPNIL